MISVFEMLKMPNKMAQFKLKSLMSAFVEMQFYSYAAQSGLMNELVAPAGKNDLARSMNITNVDQFEHVLKLGTNLKALSFNNGKYSLRGSLAKAMASSSGNPITSMIKEMASYHGDVFRNLPENLRGSGQKDYLGEYGAIVAESSRIIEPFIKSYIYSLLDKSEKYHILEIGCGTAEYFKYYYERNSRNTGVGIDIDVNVVKQAQNDLSKKVYRDNFRILCTDIRSPDTTLQEPFTLITSFQNIYYFTDVERRSLFVDLLARLENGGRFALFSVFPGTTPLSPYFDIILNSTKGCHPVPSINSVIKDLNEAGFKKIRKKRLIPGEELWGITAGK